MSETIQCPNPKCDWTGPPRARCPECGHALYVLGEASTQKPKPKPPPKPQPTPPAPTSQPALQPHKKSKSQVPALRGVLSSIAVAMGGFFRTVALALLSILNWGWRFTRALVGGVVGAIVWTFLLPLRFLQILTEWWRRRSKAIRLRPVAPSYLGGEVGELFGAVTGALTGVALGLALGVLAGFLVIAVSTIIGILGGASLGGVLGAAIGDQSEEEAGCLAVLIGLVGGAILGYYVGMALGGLLALACLGSSILVAAPGGTKVGRSFGEAFGETSAVLAGSFLSLMTGSIIASSWAGLVLGVQEVSLEEAAKFVGLGAAISGAVGALLGFVTCWAKCRDDGYRLPTAEKVAAGLLVPVGLMLSYWLITTSPPQEKWLDVSRTVELWRAKFEDSLYGKTPQPSQGTSSEGPTVPDTQILYVRENANVRTGPGKEYEVIVVAKKGTKVQYLKREGDWVKVRLPDGREGYVHSSLLASEEDSLYGKTPQPSQGTSSEGPTVPDTQILYVRENANVRTGPGKEYKVIVVAKKGTKVQHLKREGDWVKVRLPDGTEGYVHESLLAPEGR